MKSALLALLLLASGSLPAQNWIDLANVYWRTSPFNAIEGSNEKRTMNMYVVDGKAPVILNNNNVLIFGLEYQYTTISNENPLWPNYAFASHMLQLGWEHKWSDKSKMLFMTIPRFNTDYSNIGKAHFQLGGLALGTTSRSERFDWKYGLYYNGELFGPMFVPLFGFNWKINKKWRFKLTIPLNLEIAYMPKDWFRAGLRFDGVNASYAYTPLPDASSSLGYIDKADNNAWLFSDFRIGKNIWCHIKAGYSILRKYRYFLGGDQMTLKLGPVNIIDERHYGNPKNVPLLFKNGYSFELRFLYRLPI